MGSTVIAGKPSNTVGEKNSTLILRGSSVKILWGNKFIDLIKDGKINSESEKILKTIDSEESISSDGIYLIEDLIWVVINGKKTLLSVSSTDTLLSFLKEPLPIEQRELVLTNIGFYYKTLDDVKNSGLTSGLVYILNENKLYTISDSSILEYSTGSTTTNTSLQGTSENVSLDYNNTEYIILKPEGVFINKEMILTQYPKYDSELTVPLDYNSELYDLNVPNIKWIKLLISYFIPSGTIVMWSGVEIPEGWVICNGANGTPNLIGKFIKASDSANTTGGSNSITLSVDNLPDHQHKISEMNTLLSGGSVHSHVVPSLNIESSDASVSDSTITWKTIPENTENLSDITTVKGGSILNLSNGDYYLDTDIVNTNYSHSIGIEEVNTDSVTIEEHSHVIEEHTTSSTIDANNSEIIIEPEYYSLIFIMKL